ncbi:glycosyl transferase [Xaviernesmea oryzae]|uniref:Glycosyl transferase n=1 Tax=Xaviernesmea oryzae TaxID=464029 RepID=A0A1Q9ATP6_9HYPH|nr:glycosyl transferase [Xaviernesmea oryzae]OLP58721.1 glycosyl transferase [Xaviernesmea oryzae]SEK70021.1 hypothetical protein SAMN04487976_103320 [Xaviernesmea oryzae]
MLTIILETRNAEAGLAHSLAGLVPGAVEGLVSDVLILDHASRDRAREVADAAGARFFTEWDLPGVLAQARGNWVLFLEAGARPTGRWIEDLADHMALRGGPARFTRSRLHRRGLWQRLMHRGSALELGLLLPMALARACAPGQTPQSLVARAKPRHRLASELLPASALGD